MRRHRNNRRSRRTQITESDIRSMIREELSILNEDTMQVAETIWKQLGGSRFKSMTGVKNIMGVQPDTLKHYDVERLGDGLIMNLPRGAKTRDGDALNRFLIVLNGRDTYDAYYGYKRGGSLKWKAKDLGLYADMLEDSFERNTGLYTSF